MASMSDLRITNKQMFNHAKNNKNLTQTDLLESLLLERFGISALLLKDAEYIQYETAISSIRKKLCAFLQNCSKSKTLRYVNEDVFLDLDDFPLLRSLKDRAKNNDPCFLKEGGSSTHTTFVASKNPTVNPLDNEGRDWRKTSRKHFDDLQSHKQRQSRSDPILRQIKSWAEEENMQVENLIAFLGYRYCWPQNPKLANVFKCIWKDEEVNSVQNVPVEVATYLKEASLIGKRKYTDLRLILKPYVIFPPYDAVSWFIQNTMPDIRPLNDGIRVDVLDVAERTIARLPNHVIDDFYQISQNNKSVTFTAKFACGFDSSGGHKVYNSKSSLTKDTDMSHYIAAGMSLNEVFINNYRKDSVYSVVKACAFTNERPLAIIPGKEKRENIVDLMSLLDIAVLKGREKDVFIDFGHFQAKFKIDISISQLDTKTIKTVTGLDGCYCTCCTSSDYEAHDVEKIQAGFPINRTVETTSELFSDLAVLDIDGKEFIPKTVRDYKRRSGLCHKPITKTDICGNIAVLHSYLNSLTFFEQILYSLNSGVLKMKNRFNPKIISKQEKEQLSKAKTQVQKNAKEGELFTRIDMPDAAGHGGNSDTGNIARKWFSKDDRSAVLKLIEDEDEESLQEKRKKYGDLLQRFSVILRILSSKQTQIRYGMFEDYCYVTYKKILEYFSWVHIPGTIHRLLAHAGQRIHLNDNYGLGSLSEESIEVAHKMLRRFRELGARKCSVKDNLVDVFKHWWAQSDPRIQSVARVYKCSNCLLFYHTKRSCRIRSNYLASSFEDIDDDTIYASFLMAV